MSHNVHTDICENVLALGDLGQTEEEWGDLLEAVDNVKTRPVATWKHGWTFSLATEPNEHGKKGKLFAFIAKKGELEIFLLNSSQYENIGKHEWTAFCSDRNAVEQFWIDFADEIPNHSKIDDIDTVEQWW